MEPVRLDVRPVAPVGDVRPAQVGAPPSDINFESVLRGAIEHATAADHAATGRVEALAAGVTDDLHGTMIAVKEAEIGVKLIGSVRNKLLDAFHELWRTGV